MAFKEVLDLNCEITVSLGGTNRKTNKPNPKSIEGYYLGKREVEDKKKKSGVSYIYALQTQKGNVGVWGKTDMDRKMSSVAPGTMIRITHSGMRQTPNGDMYVYKVEVDKDNTLDVSDLDQSGAAEPESYESQETAAEDEVQGYDSEGEDGSLDQEEEQLDEVPPSRAAAPKRPVAAVDAERAAKVAALLGKGKKVS